MSRWKELPAELHPHVHQLVVRLRRLKDHGGLSMRQLAAKTGYSAKSWERYLNGRSLPPREAVEAMARIAGDDPARLLVLHEVASEHWGQARGAAPAGLGTAEPEIAEDEPRRGRPRRVAVVAGAVALVLAVSAAVLLAVRLTDGSGGPERGGSAAAATVTTSTPSASRSPTAYTCRVERTDGRWYAGNSRSEDAIVAYGEAGPEVAEVQCLLERAGLSPGEIDGIFGPLTQRAVKRVQQRDGLVVDGIVGPHTWKALRGTTPT
ncbi:peptidoglycan-binding protein [Streptomyces sp. NPDC057376]|uniref:peptidoglycan-binding protein n=1 Tax=unclassified Streptomyces TaxID=2593676 RepID=UPI00093D35D1|nr:peptidoglycan-binding protein [Streptomyces sp. CB02414]OKI88563.1 peptidoglycan-binding protein [Streptomyces sp. CB02414]